MIDLEDHAIEIQNGKLLQRTQSSKDGLVRVIRAIDAQLQLERATPEDENLLRAKRAEAQERTRSLLECLATEKERILMAMEEGHGRWVQFHNTKNHSTDAIARFIQRKEASLASQKNKWRLRVPEFTATILDDLQVEDSMEHKDRNTENEMVFILQEAMKAVVACKGIDLPTLNKVLTYLFAMPRKSVLILHYGAQLLAMVCETEQEYLQGKQGISNWACLGALTSLLPAAMTYVRSAEAVADMAVILLPSAVQAGKALLELHHAARYCQFANQTAASTHARQSMDFSAKRKSKDEGAILRGVRDAWERHHAQITSALVDCINLLQHSFRQHPFDFHFSLSERATKGHVSVGTLRRIVVDQHTVVANLLQCACMICLAPSSQHSSVDDPMRDELMARSLKLGLLAISQYSMRLGHPTSVMALSVRDELFFAVQDHDGVAALDCLAAALSCGLCSAETISILAEAANVMRHRYLSFFYASAFLKCVLAAALYYVEQGSLQPATTASRQRDPLASLLAECAERVVAVCCAHRNSLTICHKGFLAVRLLMTDAFLKRVAVEEVVSKPLLIVLDPWICGDRLTGDDDSDEEVDGGADEEGTVMTASTARTADSSTVQSLGNISTLTSLEPHAYMLKFRQVMLRQAFHNQDVPATEMNFVDVVKYACEHHSQSSEVLEQVLLLIDHMSNKAQMCKFLLVETGLPLVLQRMLDSRPAELYIAALVGLCLEDLEI